MDWKHAQPVKEVTPEGPFSDHPEKIAMGRGHNASVYAPGPRAAQTFELPLL